MIDTLLWVISIYLKNVDIVPITKMVKSHFYIHNTFL